MSRSLILWTVWITLTLSAAAIVMTIVVYGGNRAFLLVGRTTDGHHQIELACDACHTTPFGGGAVLQQSCENCHGAQLKAEGDAHPKAKFTDPRNADRVAILDARSCVTCHKEHRPGITHAMGLTLPEDYCLRCHEDIGEERPSHKGLAFATCANAGCHNYHDNRALYADFLVKHYNRPDQLETQTISLAAFLARKDAALKAAKPLAAADADAPRAHMNEDALRAWAADVHAQAGVNCSGCHTQAERGWIAAPGLAACADCHADQARTFTEGKHGMRLREGLLATNDGPFGLFHKTPLAPMTPAQARIPMRADAAHSVLGCNTCHAAHDFDPVRAQVDACAGCHDDRHTRAYFASPHYELFKKEASGALPRGSGVSCATCHMPAAEVRRADGSRANFVTHNQNENLRPNDKMARSVCGHCHGLQFTLDALADRALVERNFKGQSAIRIESIDWAKRRQEERARARK